MDNGIFLLEIDRTSATLDEKEALIAMQESLVTAFNTINSLGLLPSNQIITSYNHSFTYQLEDYSKKYAENGLVELERNIPFTLLINQKEKRKINSVSIDTADTNRKALRQFTKEYISFLDLLINAKLSGLHHLVLSGLPTDIDNYSNKTWYVENIQKPIRAFLISKEIVQTVSGDFITIGKAIFPSNDLIGDEDFYWLISSLLPTKVPNESSMDFWNQSIQQEIAQWPNEITISLESLLAKIPSIINLESESSIAILGKLYAYLEKINSTLGEKYPIYLNEKKKFKTRVEVVLYPKIDDEIKKVSAGLGRDLDEEFLNKKLGIVAGVKSFELTEFYKTLNTEVISSLSEKTASPDQIKAILHICSLFRSDRAFKREKWYSIVKQLLPEKIGEKKNILINYENYGSSAELWSIKYLSYLIETQNTLINFINTYFEGDETSCLNG